MIELHHASDQHPHGSAHQEVHVDVVGYFLGGEVMNVGARRFPVSTQHVVQKLGRFVKSVVSLVLDEALAKLHALQPLGEIFFVVEVQQDVGVLERFEVAHLADKLDAFEQLVPHDSRFVRVELIVPAEVDHDDQHADVLAVEHPDPLVLRRVLTPEVLQAETPEVFVLVQGLPVLCDVIVAEPDGIVQDRVRRLVDAFSDVAAHEGRAEPFQRQVRGLGPFEVKFELFGVDGVGFRVDVDEEQLETFFIFVFRLFNFLVNFNRTLSIKPFFIVIKRRD